jgi:hypothetical protein
MKFGKGGLQVLSAANKFGFLATCPFGWLELGLRFF